MPRDKKQAQKCMVLLFLIFSPVKGWRNIAMSMSLCLPVCLSVCPLAYLAYLKNTRPNFTKFSVLCYLSPWLGPSLTTVQCYVLLVLWGQWARMKDNVMFRRVHQMAATGAKLLSTITGLFLFIYVNNST